MCIPISLFLLQNIDCGYSLEPPQLKKNICLLHGQVLVMHSCKDHNATLVYIDQLVKGVEIENPLRHTDTFLLH